MTATQIVGLLNELFKIDPGAIDALLCNRVPVNKEMLDHPTAMCDTKNTNGDFPTIGLLGIVNAIAALDGELIEACYDDETHCLIHFQTKPFKEEIENRKLTYMEMG